MKEVFTQFKGKGLIDIKGDQDSAIFFHKKQPKVVAWEMDYNTLLDYFAGDLPDKQLYYIQEYYKLIDLLEIGNLPGKNLVEALNPFMQILPNSNYEIEIVEYKYKHLMVRAGMDQDTIYEPGKVSKALAYQYYAGCEPFYVYATQRYLNKNRVTYYETLLSQGKKPLPIILAVKDGAIKFIVDGHHKTQAYINQNRTIKAIQISKIDNTSIDPKLFKQIVKEFSQHPELLQSLDYLIEKK